MKLEDMMEHYKLTEETIVPETELSDDEKKRILAMTLEKAGLQAPAKPRRRRKWGFAAIACALILAMATVSFAAMALDKNFFSFFGAHTDEEKELLGSLGTVIDQKVTDNGTTLHVREAVGDGNAVNILFDLIAPEGTVLDGSYYLFGSSFITLINTPSGAGYYFEQLADEDSKDNKLTFMLCYDASKNLSGQSMSFHLENLMLPKNAEEMAAVEALPPRTEPGTPGDEYDYSKVILSGRWDLTLELNYKDSSQTLKTNTEVSLEGRECRVTSVRYSPISVTVTLKGDALRAFDEGVFAATAPSFEVLKKDGTVIPAAGSSTSSRLNQMIITSQFEKLTDPQDIAAISIGGVEIPLN